MSGRPLNVLLVFPGSRVTKLGSFRGVHLVALGSAVKTWTGARVRVLDLDYERFLPEPDIDSLFDTEIDLIGFSCYSSFEYLKTYYLAVEVRKRLPKVCMVVGGYHPSARPGEFLDEDSPFDHVVVGEGEVPLRRIVEGLMAGKPVQERVLGPERVESLDELPPLDWSLLDRYRDVTEAFGAEVNLNLSRGCPYTCSFCMERALRSPGWRPYSPARAEQEILALHHWLGLDNRRLFICDPLFGLEPGWRREMLERITRLDLPVGLIWALSRVDTLDEEDLPAFKRANFSLGFGLESGDPGMLEIIHKAGGAARYLERVADFSERASAIGLSWGANIIVGHPGETAETMERSAAWISDLFRRIPAPTGFVSVDHFRFYPGSGIDAELAKLEQRYGTEIIWPEWWQYTEQHFTSMWVNPSSSLDFRTRFRLTKQLFKPVLEEIRQRIVYDGPEAETFYGGAEEQINLLGPAFRTDIIVNYHLWQGLTGKGEDDPAGDPEAAEALRELRTGAVARVVEHFGELPEPLHRALVEVPRERFVPSSLVLRSAEDVALPLLEDSSSTISALHAYANNYRLLDLEEGDVFLELGGGTGYGAAVAARLVGPTGKVRSVEIEAELADKASKILAGEDRIEVISGAVELDGQLADGFNKVLYCYALEKLPDGLDALPEGGRLVAPVLSDDGNQVLTMVQRTASGLETSEHGAVIYVADKAEA